MFDIVARTVSNWRGIIAIIIAWILVAAILQATAPAIEDVSTNDTSDFLPNGSETVMAVELAEEKFASTDGLPAIIILRNPNGLTQDDLATAAAIDQTLRSEEAPEEIIAVISDFAPNPFAQATPENQDQTPAESPAEQQFPSMSPDGTAITITAIIGVDAIDEPFSEAVTWLQNLDEKLGINDEIQVSVTGPAGILSDALDIFASFDFRVTLITVSLVLVLMLLIYRSPLLALLPIVAVGFAFTVAQSIAALLTDNFGLSLNGQVTAIMSVLMFGVGTDFTLFIVSRYKEEILRQENRFDAIAASMRAVGPSIASSAGTTIIAMLALMLALSGDLQTMGPMLAMAVSVMLIGAMTIIPGLLVAMGPVAFWPFSPYKQKPAEAGIWHRIAILVSKRPGTLLSTTVIALAILATGLLSLSPSFSFIEGFPQDLESRQGFDSLKEAYPAGELAPTNVYIAKDNVSMLDHLNAIEEIATALLTDPGVDKVSGLTRPFGQKLPFSVQTLQEATISIAQNGQPPATESPPPESLSQEEIQIMQVLAAGSRFISQDRTATQIDLVLKDDPYGISAMDIIERLRDTARNSTAASTLSGATVLVGGETATNADSRAVTTRDMFVVTPIVSAAIWIILAILLRSLVAPTYLVVSVALSFLAALGISTFVFQTILGHSGVGFNSIPFAFVFIIALGADYNIYIMSRVREETTKLGLIKGTQVAISRTGGVITSAGIILAGTFAVLTTFPLRDLFQLGFTVMLGVLLDTFVVRAILVPAIVVKLGQISWWPSKIPSIRTSSTEEASTTT